MSNSDSVHADVAGVAAAVDGDNLYLRPSNFRLLHKDPYLLVSNLCSCPNGNSAPNNTIGKNCLVSFSATAETGAVGDGGHMYVHSSWLGS